MTTGQRNDCTQAIELFRDLRADNLIADKGYDAELYKERHKIECLFGFLKH